MTFMEKVVRKNIPIWITDEAIDLEKLSKNEASRLIDKLLSNFRRLYPS